MARASKPKVHKSTVGKKKIVCGAKKPFSSFRWKDVTCLSCRKIRFGK